MNLREPLAIPADRPLDVLIHTRYSTDEQSQSSIDGQINSCQRLLTANLPRECRPEQVNVEIIREPEISGEIADRPGINQVWAGIRDHRWDVILAEESSRLYRHMTFASQFFDTAVDAGIRVICPTDYIDTADEDWPERLHSLFVCGICGGPMHAEGRNEGGYRCANSKRYTCWNRATCLRDQAHPAILRQVVDALMSVAGVSDLLVARVQELHATGGDIAAERRSLDSEARRLTTSIENIGLAIERGGGSIDSLAERLAGRERELKLVRSRLEELSSRESQRAELPSPEELLGHLESLRVDLIAGDRRAAVILRSLLVGPIRAVPYQQFGSDKVVLRAEFEVTLTSGLPAVIGESIRQDGIETLDGLTLVRRPVVVDLFEMSAVPRHAVEVYALQETGMSLSKIGTAIGISKRLAGLAAQVGAAMAARGLTDPFVRLTERPEKVSRWSRKRGHWDAGDEHRQAS